MVHKSKAKNTKTTHASYMSFDIPENPYFEDVTVHNSVEKQYDTLIKSSYIEMCNIHAKYPNIKALSWEEASLLQRKYGKNVLAVSKPNPWYRILFFSIVQPFNIILAILACISIATGDFLTMLIMFIMISISSGLKFIQEYKSSIAANALKDLIENFATVLRLYRSPDNRDPNFTDVKLMDLGCIVEEDIYMEDIVPGDLIKIRAGCLIPGDIRILVAKDLFVSESALTGESIPLDKYPLTDKEIEEKKHTFDERTSPHLVFMGSSVVAGTATAIVQKIGENTMFGQLASQIATNAPINSFQRGIRQVSYLFFYILIVMLPIVFVLSGTIQKDWFQAFLFSIGVAVGLTPEMLPMIVNANLSRGSINMAKKKVIVKHLESIINLGSMDILCSDKTGTLTQNKVALVKHVDLDGNECSFPLEIAFLNSYFQTGLRNLMDDAISDYYIKLQKKKSSSNCASDYIKVDEIPFDFIRRRMSTILKHKEGHHILVSKGAVEEILEICCKYQKSDSEICLFTKEYKEKALNLACTMNEDGLRVLAVGYKNLNTIINEFTVEDEEGLILAGLIGFLDPPKKSTAPAIKELLKLGVSIKILTGDTPVVCKKVCEEIGLPITRIVDTTDLKDLNDAQVGVIAKTATIFAKLTPYQKAQVVRSLKQNNHVVGFLGDGINDSIALKESDVGISVDDAVEVARESADMILLEKSLMVVVDGVIEGRKTYGNTMKYIMMAVSSNFGNVFSVLIASAILPFLPMKPIHLVLQNLLYDASQTMIPFDQMDEDYLLEPRKWSARSIVIFMLCFGPISSIFDFICFIFCWKYYDCTKDAEKCSSEFQTSWFILGLITQCLIVHMLRTHRIPFIQSRATWQLILSSAISIGIGILFATTPLSSSVMMLPPRAIFYPFLIVVAITYCILSQIVKNIYIYYFKTWM